MSEKQYFGIYKGTVLDNNDPSNAGRLVLSVPQVFSGRASGWCEPMYQTTDIPSPGETVWVNFVGGDPNLPIYNARNGPSTPPPPLTAYPIGSLYFSVNADTEDAVIAALGGGTWTAWGSGRVPVGVDTGQVEFSTVEKTGGEKTHTLTTNEMPNHSHGLTNGAVEFPANGTSGTDYSVNKVVGGSLGFKGASVAAAGGGNAHNNLQPYMTCYIWKRTA